MNNDIRPMGPKKILLEFDTSFLDTSPPSIDKGDARDFLRSSLRALLLHVGESMPENRDPEEVCSEPSMQPRVEAMRFGYNLALDDCKRVIEKISEQI